MDNSKTVLIITDPCFVEYEKQIKDFAALFDKQCIFLSFNDLLQESLVKESVCAVLFNENIGSSIFDIQSHFPKASLIAAWCSDSSSYTFKELKENFKVDLILESPLDIQEIGEAFRLLFENVEVSQDIPPELLKKYEAAIPQKIDSVTGLAHALQKSKSIEDASALKKEVHKIVGNASAYGFREVGEICKTFELFISETIGEPPSDEKIDLIIGRIPVFLKKFRSFFQKIVAIDRTEYEVEIKSSVEEEDLGIVEEDVVGANIESSIMLITEDVLLVQVFQESFAGSEMEVKVESVPEKALHWMESVELLPKCIVVESYYPEVRMSGMEMAAKLREKDTNKRCIFTMILDDDDLKNRIEVLEQGFHFTIKRGFPDEHLKSLKRAIEYRQQTTKVRVLLVDDDTEFNEIVTTSLRKMGMSVESLADEVKLLETIDTFKPDVLLLDLGLTTYSGLNLLKTIRMDIHNQEMIIIIFTANQSGKTEIDAFEAGADEVIFKPFHARLVASRIMNIMRRFHNIGIKRASDKSTSMLNQREFFTLFNDIYSAPSKYGMQVSLIFIQIDDYASIDIQYGTTILEDLTYSFAHALRQFFKSAQLLGNFGEGHFGLIIERLTGGEIEYLLNRFRDYALKNIPLIGVEGLKVNFSSSVCILRIGDEPLIAAGAAGESALKKAVQNGPRGLEIIRLKKEWMEKQVHDEVIIVNKDDAISTLLSLGYKKQGLLVRNLSTGSEAKRYFLNLHSLSHKCMVLMEHPLPDLETVELIQMISIKFSKQIPILCITSRMEENEVLNILDSGASDVVAMPFNSKVLLSKSLRLLYERE